MATFGTLDGEVGSGGGRGEGGEGLELLQKKNKPHINLRLKGSLEQLVVLCLVDDLAHTARHAAATTECSVNKILVNVLGLNVLIPQKNMSNVTTAAAN